MAVVLTIGVRLQAPAVSLVTSEGLLHIFKELNVYKLVPNTTTAL
jgi:hypothetical protein